MMLNCSNGRGRASNQSHHRAADFFICLRLMMNYRVIAIFTECRWGNLATSIAIDTGRVYEEIAGDIRGKS